MPFIVGEVSAPVTADASQFNEAMDKVKEEGEKTSKEVSDKFKNLSSFIGKEMEKLGKSFSLHVTAPLMAAAGIAAQSAIDFESAFAGVRKTVDATEEEFAALEQGIRDMATTLPSSANEIAGVAEAAGQLGIKNENILSFTRTMIDLGEATNLSADQAATSLARFANIIQMPQTEFDRLGSTVVALGNNLATTEAEIVDMAMGLAGAGKQIGLTEAQIMGISAALSSVGIEAQAGGSAFSRVLSQMQLAVETGNESLKDFAAVAGMTATEFSVKFREDAAGALVEFIKGLGDAQEQGISSIKVLEDMGISEIRLRDALLRTSGAGDLLAESIALSTQAWDENLALSKEAEQRYSTMASQLKILKNNVIELAIQFGEIMVPWIQKASEKVKALTEWFQNLSPAMKENVLRWAAIIAAIGPLLILGSKLILLIKGIGAALVWLSANPIGMITLAIGALIAMGINLWKNWDTIKLKASVLWDHLRVGFAKMVNWIIGKINYLIEKANKIPGINLDLIEEIDETRRFLLEQDSAVSESEQAILDYEKAMEKAVNETQNAQYAVEGFSNIQDDAALKMANLTANIEEQTKALKDLKKEAEVPEMSLMEKTMNLISARQAELLSQGDLFGALKLAEISPETSERAGKALEKLFPDGIPAFGDGGLALHPTLAKVAEKGPEAIIPLDRLGQPVVHITENIYIYGNMDRGEISQALDDSNSKLVQRLRLSSPGVVL